MSNHLLDHLTHVDPREQERYGRVALAHATIPGEAAFTLDRLDGSNALSLVRHLIDTYPHPINETDILESLSQIQQGTHQVLIPTDAEWPTGLRDLGSTQPLALWVRGDVSLAQTPPKTVTITGARAATSYGESVATEFTRHLADTGHSIVTGGAHGIDAAATRAAGPRGVVVLASGIDRAYPAGNAELLQRVAHNGLVLTEAPPHVAPTRARFIARARILAALSDATVIVEAGARSGAIAVANTAHWLGRTVGAVPGPITSAASTGCHILIRQGTARLITHATDVTITPDQ
ncbi:DNA-processing protein DprA [Microbacterium sp. CH-015]|uniref:DNA-processing protein DprA n=1 Tax=Microbacterium sp. CH-015 TaxID=3406734 RepID=UPI003C7666E6